MKLFLRITFVFGLTLSFSACSIFFGDSGMFRSRGKDYLTSGPIKPVEVPEGMSVTSLEELYQVPNLKVNDEFGDRLDLGEYDVPRPRSFTTDKSGVAVKIQSQLGKRWIFLNASTSQVWPQTQSFLSSNDFEVVRSDANKGIIESGWMQFKTDLTHMCRFRIKIEKGIHTDTTEVHVREVELPVGDQLPQDFTWPENSDNDEREKFVVDKLAKALAESVDNKAASLMGQNVGGRERVEYANDNNEAQLKIHLPWERAYASIAASVKSDAFKLWEQDGDRKLFYLGYEKNVEKKKGFFRKMAFWSSDDDSENGVAEKAKYSLNDVLAKLEDKPSVRKMFGDMPGIAYGDDLPGASGYLLIVRTSIEDGEEVQSVLVRDYRGEKIAASRSKEILRLVRSNLI